MVDILSYFSYEENWNLETIEKVLIPKILTYSGTFNGGQVADFSQIRNVSLQQARILLRLFRNCSELLIDHMITPNLQLCYISNFKSLQKLTITIKDVDNFLKNNDHLTIKKLKIIAKSDTFEFDPISQILNISPYLEKISFRGGLISMTSMNLFGNLKLKNIKLKNTKFVPSTKKTILSYIETNTNLSSLKLILTETFFTNESFYEISYNFLKVFSNQQNNIEKLTFTLCQYSEQKLFHLKNFPNLKILKIYYSAQFNTKNFNNLINILIQLNDNIEITIIEYLSPPLEIHHRTYLKELSLQSSRIKMMILDSIIGHRIKIITCEDYEK